MIGVPMKREEDTGKHGDCHIDVEVDGGLTGYKPYRMASSCQKQGRGKEGLSSAASGRA